MSYSQHHCRLSSCRPLRRASELDQAPWRRNSLRLFKVEGCVATKLIISLVIGLSAELDNDLDVVAALNVVASKDLLLEIGKANILRR